MCGSNILHPHNVRALVSTSVHGHKWSLDICCEDEHTVAEITIAKVTMVEITCIYCLLSKINACDLIGRSL